MIRLSAQVGGITVELEQEEPRGWRGDRAAKDQNAIARDEIAERFVMRRFAHALRMVEQAGIEVPGS